MEAVEEPEGMVALDGIQGNRGAGRYEGIPGDARFVREVLREYFFNEGAVDFQWEKVP